MKASQVTTIWSFLSQKKVFIPIGVIAVLLLVFFYGKKLGKQLIKPKKLPDQLNGMQDLTEAENATVMNLSRRLYEDLKGWTIFYRDLSVYQDLLALSDYMFVAVYNYFNEMYAKDKIAQWGTLKQWIQDENPQGVNGTHFKKVKPSILARMDSLNLT